MKNRNIYIFITIVLFVVEFMIEGYFKQGFIRYYVGDVFAAMLLYTLTKSIMTVKPIKLAIGVLIFTFSIEFLQLIDILAILRIAKTKFTSIVLGHSYSSIDLVCYFVGVGVVFICDYYWLDKKNKL